MGRGGRCGCVPYTALVVISLILSTIPWMVPAEPASRGGVTGCPESMPPPLVKGNRTGDWKITCDVVVEETTVKLRGNITVDFGGSLELKESATIEQDIHDTGPYTFTVYNQASLTVKKSTLRTDGMTVLGSGDVFIRESTVRVRGGVQAAGGLFELTDSMMTVMPDAYGIEPDVHLNISAQALFIRGSTVQVKGMSASPGNSTTPPRDGGDAKVRLRGQLVTNLTLSVFGGTGGRAWDQVVGNGHHGGDGGDAELDLRAIDIRNLRLEVGGGDGGKGGNGAESLTNVNGGNGGDGGNAGQGVLDLDIDDTNITDTTVTIYGGKGGGAGHGGKTKGGSGGNAGVGGWGGSSKVSIEGVGARVQGSSLRSSGGMGGSSGLYGKDLQEIDHGNPGRAGPGGEATMKFHLFKDLALTGSSVVVEGGDGPDGAPGWQFGSDGGPGGNATLSIFTAGNLTLGPMDDQTMVKMTVEGGCAGDGGEYEGGTGETYMGRTGSAGSAKAEMDILGTADLVRTELDIAVGKEGIGRDPIFGERAGHDTLLLSAARYNVTDSTSTTPFEGLRDFGLGWLVNTKVQGEVPAYVWSWEGAAMIKVWWHLDVNISPMFENQKAQVYVKDADHPDRPVVESCTLRGSWDTCSFLLLGEYITSKGQFVQNYTVDGSTEDGTEYAPVTFYLKDRKGITLLPKGNFYAPHVNLTYPENGATFTVEDLASGTIDVYGTASEDIRDDPVWITDVQVSFMEWKTRDVIMFDGSSGVNITPLTSSISSWSLVWDLNEKVGYMPRFKSGAYRLCVRAFDGQVWSDDTDARRGGKETCINIAIFQLEGKKPVVPFPSSFPARVTGEIPADGAYVEIEFDVTVIEELGATLTYFKFEWDLDLDGKMDWVYFPGEGTRPPAATKVYTLAGIYTARMYATDINGDVSTVDTQVVVTKGTGKSDTPVAVPNHCLTAFLAALVALGVIWIAANFNELLKFLILMKVLVPIHRSTKKDLPKEDSIRRQILDYISEKPGRFFTRVKLDLEMRSLMLARELTFLEEQGYAVHKRDGWRVRLISTRKLEKKRTTIKPWQKKVLKVLIKRPWQSAAELADKVGRSQTFIEGQLRRLEKRKLVVVRYDPDEGPLYRAKIPGRKKGSYKRKRPST